MIKEFALEPDALATWESFRYFIEKFGIAHGRVISRFPKDWKRLVYQAAQRVLGGTTQLSKLEVKLRAIGDDVLFPAGRPGGDASKSWLERALAEHARHPFDGIIASANPTSLAHVLVQSEVDEQDPRFSVPTQTEVQRTAVRLVECAELMLRHTTIVKWVDYRIVPCTARWQRPLREAIRVISANGTPVLFQIHREWEVGNDVHRNNLVREFRDGIEAHRGKGLTFELHLHPPKTLHDRFILTDWGGIQIGHGLDDNEDGGSTPTANVSLLEQGMFQIQWQLCSKPAFVLRLDP